jgi:hypothetical protein
LQETKGEKKKEKEREQEIKDEWGIERGKRGTTE